MHLNHSFIQRDKRNCTVYGIKAQKMSTFEMQIYNLFMPVAAQINIKQKL